MGLWKIVEERGQAAWVMSLLFPHEKTERVIKLVGKAIDLFLP